MAGPAPKQGASAAVLPGHPPCRTPARPQMTPAAGSQTCKHQYAVCRDGLSRLQVVCLTPANPHLSSHPHQLVGAQCSGCKHTWPLKARPAGAGAGATAVCAQNGMCGEARRHGGWPVCLPACHGGPGAHIGGSPAAGTPAMAHSTADVGVCFSNQKQLGSFASWCVPRQCYCFCVSLTRLATMYVRAPATGSPSHSCRWQHCPAPTPAPGIPLEARTHREAATAGLTCVSGGACVRNTSRNSRYCGLVWFGLTSR